MRLIRLGDEASKVGSDVRAALASWGRGDGVVGGIALIGCQPVNCPRPVDAVLVLPRGVLVVVGVDLPDPAVRLDAPLGGQWKTDGWPLVRPDGAINPAVEALEISTAISARLQAERVEPLPVATVVAVGPYVSQVSQPTPDLLRGVRILHPEPMTLLTATRELATYQRKCTVEQAKAVVRALQPDYDGLDSVELTDEGFAEFVTTGLAAASTTLIPRIDPAAGDGETRTAAGQPRASGRTGQLRWLPVGASVLVALLLVTGIVFAVASAGDTGQASDPPQTTAESPAAAPPIKLDGAAFHPKGEQVDADCAEHAYGDVRVWLERNPCTQLVRLRYESAVADRTAAILVAAVRLPDSESASKLRATASKPGTGGIHDVSVEGTPWPDGGKPFFESAAYLSGVEGNTVKLVLVGWMNAQSTPEDKKLNDLATLALRLPVPE